MENKGKTIVVNPVSRVEGHGKITVHLNDENAVDSVQFHVTQFRGFEVFTHGRDFREMPVVMPRICGICPVSHHLASAKACDEIIGADLTPAAYKLREVMHYAQYVQSHALSFFHLSSPDLLFGFDADPAIRNVAGLVEKDPALAVLGVTLRKYGQEIIKTLGDKKVHPWHSIPGGVSKCLTKKECDDYLKEIPSVIEGIEKAIGIARDYLEKNQELAKMYATVETGYLGLVKKTYSYEEDSEKGVLELYDGILRLRGANGRVIDEFEPFEYADKIGEHVEPWSYLKFPFYRAFGYPQGAYRVGPLARINACDLISTPKADEELRRLREAGKNSNGMVHFTLYYHYARLIEALYAAERLGELFEDRDVCSNDLHCPQGNELNPEGVGIVEAPRGTLIHHYKVDERGAITAANLIVATGHNNIAINRGVEQVAREFITDGANVKEGVLNRMEHVIRCYDPCLSCSTHALGKMPLELEILSPEREVLKTIVQE